MKKNGLIWICALLQCPGVVTVLICSFFVAALLLIYINLKNGGKNIHIFTNCQTFSYLFCIFSQKLSQVY